MTLCMAYFELLRGFALVLKSVSYLDDTMRSIKMDR